VKVEIVQVPWGTGLIAAHDLVRGEVVLEFVGPIVGWGDVPAHEVRHVLGLGNGRWMIPDSPARFADHACDPTCDLVHTSLIARRDLPAGTPITFVYNDLDPGDPVPAWDPRWSFTCACGSDLCMGEIDGYAEWQNGRWVRRM
jgi:hypothetical protein